MTISLVLLGKVSCLFTENIISVLNNFYFVSKKVEKRSKNINTKNI